MAGRRAPGTVMTVRQAVLYDVLPWRRVRLTGPAVVVVLFAAELLIGSNVAGAWIGFAAVVAAAMVLGMWVRSRTSVVSIDAAAVTLRVALRRLRVPFADITAARAGTLAQLRGRGRTDAEVLKVAWSQVPAVALTVSQAGLDVAEPERRLGKRLAARYFHGRDLVIPVAQPKALRDAVTARLVRTGGDGEPKPVRSRRPARRPKRRAAQR